ncbi:hypothetical protein F4778DRAFT_731196 [Xylariomycetidae sp. FL2044]|nr:hypothetical protein F4778DRAFT_731196 [Xylariomycetidae sp. FL2044]
MTIDHELDGLPSSASPNLHLTHPTNNECVKIWTNTFKAWGDSLRLPDYLRESLYLTTVPLARDGGMTMWILVDKTLAPDHRPILCSCESFYKRSLVSDGEGQVEEVIVHGIASVFCPEQYRRRRYAARHMKEVGQTLRHWQSDQIRVAGSVLYSDIGKSYYSKLGWTPNPTNLHLDFSPMKTSVSHLIQEIPEAKIPEFCMRDEVMIRAAMSNPEPEGQKKRLTILPDLQHMLWHIRKEDFATDHLFGQRPQAKGAIAGEPGKQVWTIWTHRYYGRHDAKVTDNVLYILRLVVEGDESANRPVPSDQSSQAILPSDQVISLKAVLQAAQAEAYTWHLDHVKLWEPSPCVEEAITRSGIGHFAVEREEDSIASGMWYGDNNSTGPSPIWINNEHYAWC